jgi:hypothetical protein
VAACPAYACLAETPRAGVARATVCSSGQRVIVQIGLRDVNAERMDVGERLISVVQDGLPTARWEIVRKTVQTGDELSVIL